MKVKKCRVCKIEFIPAKPLQSVCGYKCALDTAAKKRIKTEKRKDYEARQQLKSAKDAIKTRQEWIKEAQQVFNAWIRQRDINDPCISCLRHHDGQYHAGHYRTTKAAPELRFNELNVHKQCSVCNNHLSGNILEYRINLIKKLGIEQVEELEGNRPPKKYTIPELQAIKAEYKAKLKNILNKYCI